MRVHVILFTVLLGSMLSGCKETDTDATERMPRQLTGIPVLSGGTLGNLCAVYSTGQGFITVSDADTVIHLYDCHGCLLGALLPKGNGDSEVMFASSLQAGSPDACLYVPDRMGHKLLCISDAFGSLPVVENVFTLPENSCEAMPFDWWGVLADSTIIAANQTPQGLLVRFRPDGSITEFIGHWPETGVIEETAAGSDRPLRPMCTVAPDGRRFALAYQNSDFIGTGSLDGDSVGFRSSRIPASSTGHPRPQVLSIASGNDHIYVLLIEVNQSRAPEYRINIQSTSIGVFDWDGAFTGRLCLDQPVTKIAVDNSEINIYGIAESDTDGSVVIQFNI